METSTDVQLAKELSKNAAGQKAKSGQMDTLKSVTRVTKLVGLCFKTLQEVLEFDMEAEVQNEFQVPFESLEKCSIFGSFLQTHLH